MNLPFPPLLLSPCDEFVQDASLEKFALKACQTIQEDRCCIMSATDATNRQMLVSSVDIATLSSVAQAFAPWAEQAWVLILSFPHNAFAINTSYKFLRPSKAQLPA